LLLIYKANQNLSKAKLLNIITVIVKLPRLLECIIEPLHIHCYAYENLSSASLQDSLRYRWI